jgi:hypothetical protein
MRERKELAARHGAPRNTRSTEVRSWHSPSQLLAVLRRKEGIDLVVTGAPWTLVPNGCQG